MQGIDLHTHTTASDGTDTPEELIDYAIKKNLSAISITDHDTIDGLKQAITYSNNKAIEVISGIEFSTSEPRYPFDIHILGFGFDPNNIEFNQSLYKIRDSRHQRNLKIIKKLAELDMHISIEELAESAYGGVITRAHFGKLMKEKGYIKKEQVAYDKYIGNDCIAYVAREELTPKTAIEIIIKAGGIPVLAHPTLYKLKQKGIEELIDYLITQGLRGVEAVYSLYDTNQEQHLKKVAKDRGLVISGGSDYHGKNKPYLNLGTGRGKLFVPYKILENIKKELSE